MKMKSEKGYTGIDIAISVVVLFIFVSIIVVLSYNVNSSLKELQLKSEAVDLAVEEIEKMKNKTFETLLSELGQEENSYGKSEEDAKIEDIKEGFYRKIIVQDYNDFDKSKESNIVKKITVQILYKFKTKEQKVELSTIMSKEI